MSTDLLLGTFGDLSKVQHQIEATLNNNCATTKYEDIAETANEVEKKEEILAAKNAHQDEKPKEEPVQSLHTFKKGERAKMLADGYTKGINFEVLFVRHKVIEAQFHCIQLWTIPEFVCL